MHNDQLDFFKARYGSMDTEELVDLRRKGQLTEVASQVLEEELQKRGIASDEIHRIEKELVENSYDEKFKHFASGADRFEARCIDTISAVVISAAIILLGNFLSQMWLVFVGIAFWFLYHLFMDSLPGGQSIGKRSTNIAVVSSKTYRPCSILQSFVRNLLLMFIGIMFIGIIDIALMFGERRQRMGDMAAGTVVVKAGYRNAKPS